MKGHLAEMMATHAQNGHVAWIGVRSERYAPLIRLERVEVTGTGLQGDHAHGGKRAVTLFQAEHLPVISGVLGGKPVTADMLRRNIVIAGLNLTALRKGLIALGDVVLEIEGPCPPCSRMEKILGPGGYNAMRGHGGWYASVVQSGTVAIGDPVVPQKARPAV